MAPAIEGQGQFIERSLATSIRLSQLCIRDALGPAHQNAKHAHHKQSQDYYKENFTYLDHNQSPSATGLRGTNHDELSYVILCLPTAATADY